jgi:predicted transcriptional regulator
MHKITIETDTRTLARLDAWAAALEQSQEGLIRQALEAYLQQLEQQIPQELAAYALPSWQEDDLDEFLAYLQAERQQSLQDDDT